MLNKYRESIYIRVKKNSFHALNCKTNCEHVEISATPFSTQRLAVGDFFVAIKTLSIAISRVISKSMFKLSPIIIMQQQYLCEGGLSGVEERVLLELTHNIRPYKVYVWQGAELSKQDVLDQIYKKK
ncbi:hypothetical protein PE36_17902 [Moritella sp. PE36]|uniref:hypothetical protein n=1 Tax=Moritella sp. PE36 TaxID=58051 RepID=UPI000156954C|nr:hypothetical protein [Moritella sp. PE36]EDM65209.1 hypothetical protein PE36_17902 [Moritella sp. PE36]